MQYRWVMASAVGGYFSAAPQAMSQKSMLTGSASPWLWEADSEADSDRLRFALFHELGHIFMNHYRDFPETMDPARAVDTALEAEADSLALNLMAPVPLVDVIRYNRPRQAKASLFGLSRSAWMRRLDSLAEDRSFITAEMADTVLFSFRSWLLGRRCPSCGLCFEDTADTGCCPSCGCTELEWLLEENPA